MKLPRCNYFKSSVITFARIVLANSIPSLAPAKPDAEFSTEVNWSRDVDTSLPVMCKMGRKGVFSDTFVMMHLKNHLITFQPYVRVVVFFNVGVFITIFLL